MLTIRGEVARWLCGHASQQRTLDEPLSAAKGDGLRGSWTFHAQSIVFLKASSRYLAPDGRGPSGRTMAPARRCERPALAGASRVGAGTARKRGSCRAQIPTGGRASPDQHVARNAGAACGDSRSRPAPLATSGAAACCRPSWAPAWHPPSHRSVTKHARRVWTFWRCDLRPRRGRSGSHHLFLQARHVIGSLGTISPQVEWPERRVREAARSPRGVAGTHDHGLRESVPQMAAVTSCRQTAAACGTGVHRHRLPNQGPENRRRPAGTGGSASSRRR